MSKFTPGGWFVAEHNWNAASVYTKEKTVCLLSISEEEATEENQSGLSVEMLANARLIAAAPEMLDLLKKIADWPFPFLSGKGIDEVRELAGEMVKKVEGEA
jgi:hypothetical protein